ncbi:hypothetical protein KR018_002307, partial [Drosophila ironensis]
SSSHGLPFIQCNYLIIFVTAVQGKPWRWHWGPASNSGPIGGPAWNGGPDESTDNIIIHSNKRDGKWRY